MTSRSLVIMRHAKAEQSDSMPDTERQLTRRGRHDARAAGEWLAAQGLAPDVVLCSPATRARSTWHEVAIGVADSGISTSPTVDYADALAHSGVNAALDLLRGLPADVGTVLLIGHNPTVSALSARLDDASGRSTAGLRTAGIAVHTVSSAWSDLGTAQLAAAHTPRA
jgi:phosphohistidine phosphatase